MKPFDWNGVFFGKMPMDGIRKVAMTHIEPDIGDFDTNISLAFARPRRRWHGVVKVFGAVSGAKPVVTTASVSGQVCPASSNNLPAQPNGHRGAVDKAATGE